MTFNHIYLLPVVIFFLMPGTFIFTYIVAGTLGHVSLIFPYISDTGTFSPESCIFAQFINITSVLTFLFVWIRYRQVGLFCDSESSQYSRLKPWNKISALFGAASSAGISMVANFQEKNMLTVHMAGAFFTFGAGAVYASLQTYISYKSPPEVTTRRVAHARFVLSALGLALISTCAVAGVVSLLEFRGTDITKWKPKDGGYRWHLVSSISEWSVMFGYVVFLMTFVGELRGLSVDAPRVWNHDSSDKYEPLLNAEGNNAVEDI